jgi:hypothetical protein
MGQDPDTLVPLTTARTEFEGSALRTVLEAEGIAASVFATSANALQWEGGYTDPIKIMVRRGDYLRAAEALALNRRTAQMIDWSQVDVGTFEDADAGPSRWSDPAVQRARRLRRARFTRTGFLLMCLPMLTSMLDWKGIIIALAGAVALIGFSWNDE